MTLRQRRPRQPEHPSFSLLEMFWGDSCWGIGALLGALQTKHKDETRVFRRMLQRQ